MISNSNKLKGKMTENGFTMKSLSKELGICETSLRRKLNCESEVTLNESLNIKNILDLSINEYIEIFFGNKLELNSDAK